jgi:chemotaxis protein methyltransferase CheR
MACFREMNLFNRADMSRMSEVDVVFCRNVLIYFDGSSVKTVMAQLHRSLRPGGYLFLGHAEHLHGHSPGFVSLNVCDTFIYRSAPGVGHALTSTDTVESSRKEARRPRMADSLAEDHRPGDGRKQSAMKVAAGDKAASNDQDKAQVQLPTAALIRHQVTPAQPTTDTVEGKASLDDLRLRAIEHLCTQENTEAQGAFEEILQRAPDDVESLLGTALLCAGRGDSEAALERCERVLRTRPTSAEAYCVMALVHETLDEYALVQRELEKAIYLDGEFSIAYFRLAGLHDRLGRPDAAARELNNVLKALPDDDGQRVRIYSGGFDKGTIGRICEQRLGVESATVQEMNP